MVSDMLYAISMCSSSSLPLLPLISDMPFVLSLSVLHLSLLGASVELCLVIEAFASITRHNSTEAHYASKIRA